MNTVITSLLIMCFLPLMCAWIAGYFRKQQLGSIDNKNPRAQSAELTGVGARAVAAQSNSWEALAVFSAPILAVTLGQIDPQSIATLCLVFVALRVVYVGFYLANIDSLRSLSFLAGYGICLYMIYLALGTAN